MKELDIDSIMEEYGSTKESTNENDSAKDANLVRESGETEASEKPAAAVKNKTSSISTGAKSDSDIVEKYLGKNKSKQSKKRKKSKRGLVISIIVVVVAIGGALVAMSSGWIPDVFGIFRAEQLHLRVGYSKYPYPPLHYYGTEGDLIGFDIELAKAAAEIMNAEIEFVPIDWTYREDLLVSGEVDMLWGGLERATLDPKKVEFTRSYLRSNIVFVMNDDRDYSAFEDLEDLSICALNFTPAFYYLRVYDRDVIMSSRTFTPPEYRDLFSSLLSGEYDCMIADTSFASFYNRATEVDFKVSDTVLASNYAVAVRVEDTDLFSKLQTALDQLETDGTIAILRDKWIAGP